MGRDICEFGGDELRVVGGDYGQIVIEGTTPEARRTLDEIVAASRRSDDGASIDCLIALCDDTPDLIPHRHAGREGTPDAGVGPDRPADETAAAGGTGDGSVASVE